MWTTSGIWTEIYLFQRKKNRSISIRSCRFPKSISYREWELREYERLRLFFFLLLLRSREILDCFSVLLGFCEPLDIIDAILLDFGSGGEYDRWSSDFKLMCLLFFCILNGVPSSSSCMFPINCSSTKFVAKFSCLEFISLTLLLLQLFSCSLFTEIEVGFAVLKIILFNSGFFNLNLNFFRSTFCWFAFKIFGSASILVQLLQWWLQKFFKLYADTLETSQVLVFESQANALWIKDTTRVF